MPFEDLFNPLIKDPYFYLTITAFAVLVIATLVTTIGTVFILPRRVDPQMVRLREHLVGIKDLRDHLQTVGEIIARTEASLAAGQAHLDKHRHLRDAKGELVLPRDPKLTCLGKIRTSEEVPLELWSNPSELEEFAAPLEETLDEKVRVLLQKPFADWNTVCPLCDDSLTDDLAKTTVAYSDDEKGPMRVHVNCPGINITPIM